MENKAKINPQNRQGNFNTLGVNRTAGFKNSVPHKELVVFGNGTDGNNEKALKGRAKRKLITQKLMLQLIDIAKEKGADDRFKAYWNTYHCQSNLISADKRFFGRYCKNRFCNICNSIRKAELINKYFPIIKTWKESKFMTLTVRAVSGNQLYKRVRTIKKKFAQIIDLLNKRHQRGKGIKPIAIVSLECNFNPRDKTYNPHLHLLVPNQEIENRIFWEWRKKWKKDEVSIWAQHFRKVKNTEQDMIETIKYGAKIFTSPDMKRKSKLPPQIYAAALDNIHASFKGIQIFMTYGIKLPRQQKKSISMKTLLNYEEWDFNPNIGNWVNINTGEILSDYKPSPELQFILENNIDKKSF